MNVQICIPSFPKFQNIFVVDLIVFQAQSKINSLIVKVQ